MENKQIALATIASTDYAKELKDKYKYPKLKTVPQHLIPTIEVLKEQEPSTIEMIWYILKNTPKFVKLFYYLVMFYLKLKDWLCLKTGKQQ
jgi:hypothetical protein